MTFRNGKRFAKRRFTRRRTTTRRSTMARKPKVRIGLRRRPRPNPASVSRLLSKPRQWVKLTWDAVYQTSLASSGQSTLAWYPMCAAPISPTSNAVLASGNAIYNSLQTYANYYNYMRVHAAKVTSRLTVLSQNAATPATFSPINVVLVAVSTILDSTVNPNNTTTVLGGYSYPQLATYPGVKTAQIAYQNTKPTVLSIFRKSASMFNMKTIRDDPNSNNIMNPSLAHANWFAPPNQWAVYQIMYNNGSGNTEQVQTDVKITAWCELFNANVQVMQALT